MKIKMKLAGILLGITLASTGVYANNGSYGAGKCGDGMKKMEKKGSSGATKCGGDIKKDSKMKASGSCGTGKCG